MLCDDDGVKWACRSCITGHRSSKCTHKDRELSPIARKGRPSNQSKQAHRAALLEKQASEAAAAAANGGVIPPDTEAAINAAHRQTSHALITGRASPVLSGGIPSAAGKVVKKRSKSPSFRIAAYKNNAHSRSKSESTLSSSNSVPSGLPTVLRQIPRTHSQTALPEENGFLRDYASSTSSSSGPPSPAEAAFQVLDAPTPSTSPALPYDQYTFPAISLPSSFHNPAHSSLLAYEYAPPACDSPYSGSGDNAYRNGNADALPYAANGHHSSGSGYQRQITVKREEVSSHRSSFDSSHENNYSDNQHLHHPSYFDMQYSLKHPHSLYSEMHHPTQFVPSHPQPLQPSYHPPQYSDQLHSSSAPSYLPHYTHWQGQHDYHASPPTLHQTSWSNDQSFTAYPHLSRSAMMVDLNESRTPTPYDSLSRASTPSQSAMGSGGSVSMTTMNSTSSYTTPRHQDLHQPVPIIGDKFYYNAMDPLCPLPAQAQSY